MAGPVEGLDAAPSGAPVGRVLVVEDDRELAEAVSAALEDEHYQVSIAYDGEEAVAWARRGSFDVAVLDLLLPKMDGYQVCSALRRHCPAAAVIIVTALGAPDDIVAGFDTGADDYLVKPFGMAELKARLRALLRRSEPDRGPGAASEADETAVLASGTLRLDLGSNRAWSGDLELALRPRERDLLEVFLRRPGLVLTRNTIRAALWGPDRAVSAGAVDQHVSRLRRKLAAGRASSTIETVYGLGWQLREGQGG